MRNGLLVGVAALALAACSGTDGASGMLPLAPDTVSTIGGASAPTGDGLTLSVSAAGGFDELGYNRTARIFNGAADGADGTLDGKAYGLTLYADDHLKMKWNAEWDRGNAEGWSDPDGYDAWIDNQWNGRLRGGSGETWHYRIKWIGACGPDGAPTPGGGYCIWGQFEVLMSHGTVANQHFWDAHATPAGFGN